MDGSPSGMSGDGLNAAGPIWQKTMQALHKNLPIERFSEPKGVVSAVISLLSGKRAGESIPEGFRRSSLFVSGKVPNEVDNSF